MLTRFLEQQFFICKNSLIFRLFTLNEFSWRKRKPERAACNTSQTHCLSKVSVKIDDAFTRAAIAIQLWIMPTMFLDMFAVGLALVDAAAAAVASASASAPAAAASTTN